MVYLAKEKEKIISLGKIAKAEGIPFDFLEKIFSQLEKAGLVRAKKGAQGGYFLRKKPKKIKIKEIIGTLEGKKTLVECLSPKKYFCSREKKCLTKIFWQKFQKIIDSALNSIVLADLIK